MSRRAVLTGDEHRFTQQQVAFHGSLRNRVISQTVALTRLGQTDMAGFATTRITNSFSHSFWRPAIAGVAFALSVLNPSAHAAQDPDVFAQIERAEKIADPYQRCLAYPNPAGYQWSRETIDAFCADEFAPRLYWAEVRRLIDDGQGKQLDARLDTILQGYSANAVPEGAARYAYYANFSDSSATLEALIQSWQRQSPESAHALAALGIHRVARAQAFRGEKLYAETAPEAIQQMHAELKRARQALERSLTFNKKIMPAYEALIDAARMTGDPRLAADALRRAVEVDPANFYVRAAYSSMSEPSWGGSLEALDKIARDAKPWLKKNPRLVNLSVLALGSRGYPDYREKKYDAALPAFEHALALGPVNRYLRMAGAAAAGTGKNARAVELFSQLLRFSPFDVDARYRRGYSFSLLGKDSLARADFEALLSADPGNTSALQSYANVLLKQGDVPGAVKKLTALRGMNPSDTWVTHKLAWIYLYKLRKFEEAKPLIAQLLQANPESGSAWLLRADYLQNTNGKGLREAAENFVRYADVSQPEQRTALPKVKAWLANNASS